MVRYKMLGRDVNSAPTQYRTWVVPNTPDLTGALYTGLKSGPNPMVDISAYYIGDSTAIVDFNLPLSTQWQSLPNTPFDFPGRKVLPEQVSDSQLAIIDGYAYMFGGELTNKIYRADLNNPADWIETGATLPTKLYSSSLAIVDGYIYLFGGNDGYGAVRTIFSAPVSDPLTWTNHGSLLPQPVDSSCLGMFNGHLYLFGGQGAIGTASNTILTASTASPLSWSVGGTLPASLYGSTIFQADGYWYLLGGQTNPHTQLNTIYQSSISTPFTWQLTGNLPYHTSYGQFFAVASDGYYIGPSPGDAGTGFSTIIAAPLSNLTQWTDTKQVVPAVLSHSQIAIIYDRLWFFGGSGLSAIFACEQTLKYSPTDAVAVAYGNITRTVLQGTDNLNNPFEALSIPYWKTDYVL